MRFHKEDEALFEQTIGFHLRETIYLIVYIYELNTRNYLFKFLKIFNFLRLSPSYGIN